ncbi:MAG TPA: hypothetical protein VHJ20_09760 [Polyangia bacterium]|nr:hypothetical protein [Polyangia bacterium]
MDTRAEAQGGDERRRRAWGLAAYFAAQVLFVLVASNAFLLRIDDSYYYFGIANHVALDGRFTFDGIHPTNGFQPLWQFLLVGVTVAARAVGVVDRYVLAHVYLILCAALNTLSAWIAFGLVDQHLGRGTRGAAVAGFFFVWIPGLTASLLGGMESAVNWPLLLSFCRLLADGEGRVSLADMPARRFGPLLVVSILLVYARLDNAVILATTVVYLCLRERRAATIRMGAIWGAATLVGWAPLLLWGHRVFGSPTPVSGAVKLWNTAHFIARAGVGRYAVEVAKAFGLSVAGLPVSAVGMGYYEVLKPIAMRLGFSLVVGVLGAVALALALGLAGRLRRMSLGPRPPAPSLLPLLAFVATIHLFMLAALFPDQWMYAGLIWYDLVEYLCLFVLAGWLGGWLFGALSEASWRRLGRGALVAGAVALVPLLAWRPGAPTECQLKLDAARWINEHLPPDAVVASDDAGVLGYFARVPVVNLDGLVNERAYLDDYLKPGRKREYLRDAGVTHLADISCPKPGARFRSLLHIPADAHLVYSARGNVVDLDFCIAEINR